MLIQLSLKFEPSPEEKVVIHRLETALSRALGYDEYYDVNDELLYRIALGRFMTARYKTPTEYCLCLNG